LTWIVLCLVLLPAAQYAWMRLASTATGRLAGVWMVIAIIVGLFSLVGITSRFEGWRSVIVVMAAVGVGLAILIAARSAHRELEVRA
jgi:hypothetical protein